MQNLSAVDTAIHYIQYMYTTQSNYVELLIILSNIHSSYQHHTFQQLVGDLFVRESIHFI